MMMMPAGRYHQQHIEIGTYLPQHFEDVDTKRAFADTTLDITKEYPYLTSLKTCS